MEDKRIIKDQIIAVLHTIYDPEIPVNIYDLGLIYNIDLQDNNAEITMTFTSPNCPMADQLLEQVRSIAQYVKSIEKVDVVVTFEPAWDPDSLNDEIKLQLGML